MNQNKSIIRECVESVRRYNELGLAGKSKVILGIPTIKYAMISKAPRSPIAKSIVQFYEEYMVQIVFVARLRDILESFGDDDNQLVFLEKTSSELEEFRAIHAGLLAKHHTMIDNLSAAVDEFVESIKLDDADEVIRTIFICMKQDKLASAAAIEEAMRPFVYVGSRLIERLHDQLTADQIDLIRLLVEDLKESLVGVRHELDRKSTFNHLQTFGVVPTDGNNMELRDVVAHLLKIQISDDANLEVVTSLLKKHSLDSGVPTGMVIFVVPHPDLYFNLESLTQVTKERRPKPGEGVNARKVFKFDIIKTGDPPVARVSSSVQTLHVNAGTKRAYVLWTNNLKSFKWRDDPIDASVLNKILRLKPSQTIEQYNKLFEEAVVTARKDDGFSFNRVKYMSFTEEVTEESFLELLTSRIVAYVMDQLGDVEKASLIDAIMADTFLANLNKVFDSTKDDLGVDPKILSAHCHIIYASVAIKAATKIKKALLLHCTTEDDPITKRAVVKLVKITIQANDNIYSRVIASHYLHLA